MHLGAGAAGRPVGPGLNCAFNFTANRLLSTRLTPTNGSLSAGAVECSVCGAGNYAPTGELRVDVEGAGPSLTLARHPQAPPSAFCAPTAPTHPLLRLRAPRAQPATTRPRVSSLPINFSGSFLTIRFTLRDCHRRHRVHLVPRRHLLIRSCDFVLHVPSRQLRARG